MAIVQSPKSADAVSQYTLGQEISNRGGTDVFVWFQAGAAISVRDFVILDENYVGMGSTKTRADGAYTYMGVAEANVPNDSYGMIRIVGRTKHDFAGAVAKGANVYTSGSTGALDDASASQTRILGVVPLEAGTNNVEVMLNRPQRG